MTTHSGKGAVTTIDATGATTLTASQSGATVFLNAAAGAVITLPAAADGLEFTFVTKLAFATTSWDITAATADTMDYVISDMGATPAVVSGVDADSIDFVESAETVGDWIHCVSDGTSWFVRGTCAVNGGIVATG